MPSPVPPCRLVLAGLIADAAGTDLAPGALLLEGGDVVAVGRPEEIGRPGDAVVEDHTGDALLPPFVNAHCHLDLSHLGPVEPREDFCAWVDVIRAGRATSPEAISASVERGVRLSRAGGTALVGDIAGAGRREAIDALRASGLAGVSFLEVFGIGRGQAAAVASLERAARDIAVTEGGVRLGLQPHAPYSCGPEVYRAAVRLGLPLATHLAETLEEIRFVRDAEGPLADLLRRLGVWDETIEPRRTHPVDAVTDLLGGAPLLAAHLNYVEDRHLDRLRDAAVTVAYCPRASAYFGHPQEGRPPHRFRDMLEAGVRVVLGTDGLPCLDTRDRISVLDEMRWLYDRDGTDPRTLLEMATTSGARALGADPALFTFSPGPIAGVLAVAAETAASTAPVTLRAALRSRAAPHWLVGPIEGDRRWFRR